MRPGIIAASCVLGSIVLTASAAGQTVTEWPVHSMTRPLPPTVDAGPFTGSPSPPSDAVVLFDGRGLTAWHSDDSTHGPAKWKVENGHVEVVPGAGGISTNRGFGDMQLHVEWAAPVPARGDGQGRGNSGVFLMGLYEIQVLDSYQNVTYADGLASAVYGQYPPLVNATRPPGQWQSYDIVFRRPRFDASGAVVRPARVTVLHNNVLVQDNVTLTGPTAHHARPPYKAHADRLPIGLQDHGNPVRFRNIWVRELPESGA